MNLIIMAPLGLTGLLGLLFAARAQDNVMYGHGLLLTAFCIAGVVWLIRRNGNTGRTLDPSAGDMDYNDEVIRAGVIASTFWGVVGFLAGVFIALQLAFPLLNLDLPWTTFGRLRPLHTSAVIFAFGGNVLIMTSFHVVQRTCRARLAGGFAPWFVFWGYQLFIVMAATGYVFGATQSREYAEPEWYVDIWLTIVWVTYLLVFMGTLWKRREPHIYVANWFYLAFIVTVAMLHLVNNLSLPVSFTGAKSYSLFAGVAIMRSASSSPPASSASCITMCQSRRTARSTAIVCRSCISGAWSFSISGPARTICITRLCRTGRRHSA